MADKEKEEEIQKPKKKKSKALLIIIIVVILLIIVGVAIVFIFMGKKKNNEASTQKIHRHINVSTTNNSNSVSLAKIGILFPLDTFTVNLISNSNKQRYLKTQMSLELSNKNLAIELNAKKAVLRNKIIGVLSSRTFQEISTIKGKNKLAQQITNALNPMLSDGTIDGVFFTHFIIQ